MPAGTHLHRLSVEDVYRMVEAGVLRDEDSVELIDGVLVDMSPRGAEHSAAVAWLNRHFAGEVGEREVRVQDLLLVEGGFVMPDLMVVDPPPRHRHPSTAALVVEVAVTTQRHDAWKAGPYARAGVAEYWIVDLPGRLVTVYRAPHADRYGEVSRHRDGDRLRPLVGGPELDITAVLGSSAG